MQQQAPDPPTPNTPSRENELASTIALEMTQLFKRQFGRGPERVRVRWADADTIVCVLEDTLTPAERKLVALGEHEAVREMRMALQHATADEFCGLIEDVTGRRVFAFHSSTDTHADGQSLELFVLHPHGYDGPGRSIHH